jgi:hypothetical protein
MAEPRPEPERSARFRKALAAGVSCIALAAPPLLTWWCVFLAVQLDRLHLGPTWQIVVIFLLGPGALSVGVVTAVGAALLVSPGSRLGRVVIVVAELLLVFVVWARVTDDLVKGWK